MGEIVRPLGLSASSLFSRSPLRTALAVLALLLPVSALIATFVGREVNRIFAEQTIGLLRAELDYLRADFDRGGVDALASAVRVRAAAAPMNLYQLTLVNPVRTVGNLVGSFAEVTETGSVFSADASVAAGVAVSIPGGSRLLVARRIDDQREVADRLRYAAFTGVLLLSGLALVFGGVASMRLNQRIADINLTARSIMSGDFSRRVPRDGSGDEFDELAGSLNSMLVRIEDLMQALREVSDNIAHDLKTPLTRLRNRAEAAIRDDSAAAHREGLERVIEEADGLIKTFNALLLIARLEAGAVDATRTQCDIAELVRDVAELYQPVADEANLQIVFAAASPFVLGLNKQLVGQAVANMLDNAIKYSAGARGASAVAVSVQPSPDGCEIVIADRGPGIAAGDREHATKRFVRLEQSRSLPGTGLGLSLVAAVARLHNGSVRLEDNAPGLRIVLQLGRAGTRSTAPISTGGGVDRVGQFSHVAR